MVATGILVAEIVVVGVVSESVGVVEVVVAIAVAVDFVRQIDSVPEQVARRVDPLGCHPVGAVLVA